MRLICNCHVELALICPIKAFMVSLLHTTYYANNIWTPMYMLSGRSSFLHQIPISTCGCGLSYPLKWKFLCVEQTFLAMLIRAMCLYYATTSPSDMSKINPFLTTACPLATLRKAGNVVKDEVALDIA